MSLYVDIRKDFGRFHLDVELEAEEEIMGLLGASGCGKSVTLKCIAGVERPDEGKIVLNGRTLFDSHAHINLSPQERRVGYLFQQYALFPNMTVEKNILAGAHRMAKAERAEAVQAMMAKMQITDLAKKYPAQLSGGQQQRVALARILINGPEAILLDEPFSALDDYLKWQLELELSDTLRDFSGTVMFVSHSREEVFRICNTVCVMSDGRSGAKQPTKQLFEAPETLAAALLSGCKDFTRIKRLDETHVQALDWDVVLSCRDIADDIVYAGVRSQFVHPGTGDNEIHCRVQRVVKDLYSVIVMLETPGGGEGWSLLRMEMSYEDWAELKDPGELTVSIATDDIMYLQGG